MLLPKWQILLPHYCRLIYNHIFRDNNSVHILTDGKSHVSHVSIIVVGRCYLPRI